MSIAILLALVSAALPPPYAASPAAPQSIDCAASRCLPPAYRQLEQSLCARYINSRPPTLTSICRDAVSKGAALGCGLACGSTLFACTTVVVHAEVEKGLSKQCARYAGQQPRPLIEDTCRSAYVAGAEAACNATVASLTHQRDTETAALAAADAATLAVMHPQAAAALPVPAAVSPTPLPPSPSPASTAMAVLDVVEMAADPLLTRVVVDQYQQLAAMAEGAVAAGAAEAAAPTTIPSTASALVLPGIASSSDAVAVKETAADIASIASSNLHTPAVSAITPPVFGIRANEEPSDTAAVLEASALAAAAAADDEAPTGTLAVLPSASVHAVKNTTVAVAIAAENTAATTLNSGNRSTTPRRKRVQRAAAAVLWADEGILDNVTTLSGSIHRPVRYLEGQAAVALSGSFTNTLELMEMMPRPALSAASICPSLLCLLDVGKAPVFFEPIAMVGTGNASTDRTHRPFVLESPFASASKL